MSSYREELSLVERGLDRRKSPTSNASGGRPSSEFAGEGEGVSERGRSAGHGSGSAREGSASRETAKKQPSGKAPQGGGGGAGAGTGGDRKGKKPSNPRSRVQYDDPSAVAKVKKAQIVKREESSRVVPFLSHLPQYEKSLVPHGLRFGEDALHPELVKIGLQYAEGIIHGSSARLSALISVFRRIVEDFEMTERNETRDFRRELDKTLKKSIQFVIDCRPISISMGNFVRELKKNISSLLPTLSEEECKSQILKSVDRFRMETFELPIKTITEMGADRAIENGDIVVVYCRSFIVESILLRAKELGKDFRVVVIDSRPRHEGRELCRKLSENKISVDYGLINAASYLVEGATKVLLGAHSMMSNGALMARVGTSVVAVVCRQLRIPIIVACPAVKFSERVQLDALCFNELGDPDEVLTELTTADGLSPSNWRQVRSLHVLNLLYDLTPGENIDAVITEAGVIPASSVPVLVHEYFGGTS